MQVGRQAQAVPRVLEDEDAGVKALAIVRQEREGPVGRAAHATHPLVEAKTDDGPRLLAGHPLVTDPVDLDGPTLDPDRWVDERCELIDGAQRSVERPRADWFLGVVTRAEGRG
jgi:Flp pilus assembly CpaF family ATPase